MNFLTYPEFGYNYFIELIEVSSSNIFNFAIASNTDSSIQTRSLVLNIFVIQLYFDSIDVHSQL